MEYVELLKARIALYRRYLSEGAVGDVARSYRWLMRKDEIELTAIAQQRESAQGTAAGDVPPLPSGGAKTSLDH